MALDGLTARRARLLIRGPGRYQPEVRVHGKSLLDSQWHRSGVFQRWIKMPRMFVGF